MKKLLTVYMISICGISGAALADPPAGYYNTITGTDGPTLTTQLGTLMNSAVTRSYGDARTLLQIIEEDPNNLSNIILVYTGASVYQGWDSGSTWNREHTWPRSLGVGDDGSDYSDLHALHPCNPSTNSSRGNKQFGTLSGQWDPNAFGFNYRGRMARVAFYMKTRYSYLNIPTLGSQAQFIDWHIQNMPRDLENIRNDRVYSFQQNRNAFADHPEWVWPIFGTGPSDAQIILAGESHTQGASSLAVDLGEVIGDISTLPSYTLNLAKTGAAPTTYSITTTGDVEAVSSYQFGIGRNAQAESHQITFAGSGFGAISGTVTVNNTELTSAGSGLGSGDGDDTLTITASAIEHSLASLDGSSLVTSIEIDFGTFAVSQDPAAMDFSVFNIASPGMAADLDIDSVLILGDSAAFTTDLVATAAIASGDNAAFMVDVATASIGTYEATVFVDVSDEDLPGADAEALLMITFRAEIVGSCLADVNGDGAVSPADFTAWIAAFNASAPECDQNGDGACTPADFTAWIANFNSGC